MKTQVIIAFMVVSVMLLSCHHQPQANAPLSDAQLKESLEKTNRYLVNEEEEEIQNFVRRHQWEMVSTGSGVRYQIVKEGGSQLIQAGQLVTAEYVLFDITGDVVYSSDHDGVMKFVVGRGAVPSGLDEAVRHLHRGDVAHVIVPSHLGYGILGDQKDVPSKATLIYSLNIIEVE